MMKVIEVRADGSKRVHTVNDEPSMTDGQWKEEVDVNNILAKYKKTGHITHVRENPGKYMDLTGIPDLLGAQEVVKKAEETFMTISADVRKKFDNDPQKLIEFLGDANNKAEATELGLILPEPDTTELKKPEPGAPPQAPPKA
jgi:phage internal scaffolding protein